MAAVSLSPSPIPLSAMSTRRTPLSSNPNVANSPLRGASALAAQARLKRSYANAQREEPYGQPPPLKKQVLENGVQRPVRSPPAVRTKSQPIPQQRGNTRNFLKDRPVPNQYVEPAQQYSEKDRDNFLNWQRQQRARFPKMVFYFDSVPDDVRVKLVRHVVSLGAREEKFFSIDVTHVVTGRTVPPPERLGQGDTVEPDRRKPGTEEHPQTINPSLLDRSSEVRRKMILELGNRRAHTQDDTVKPSKSARNTDVLHRAREMGKRVYTVEKLQHIVINLELDPHSAAPAAVKPGISRGLSTASRASQSQSLLQLLQHERINGPSDRDPTATTRELHHLKGPYIYIYDMDEKLKPIMVREYPKAADKAEGEWPQFRSVAGGRCPFVEEIEIVDRQGRKPRDKEVKPAKPAVENTPSLKPPAIHSPRRTTGKRTREEWGDFLAETDNTQNRMATTVRPTEIFDPPRAPVPKQSDVRSQNFFTGRVATGRFLAGEPVASGVQPSNITSAIRSQMISSASGVGGAKAGTSKEVHGLQRKVLQKSAATSHDLSSRRATVEKSLDGLSSRSTSMGKPAGRLHDPVEDQNGKRKKSSVPAPDASLKSKRDLKPGYCENCQDKFRDFDEHIVSRKHRKFAEADENWVDLDSLLSQLKRSPRYPGFEHDDRFDEWSTAH